jgi:hypothetical protein
MYIPWAYLAGKGPEIYLHKHIKKKEKNNQKYFKNATLNKSIKLIYKPIKMHND